MKYSNFSTDFPLYGLVLAGGKSSRMGENKALIAYHQKPQVLHAAQLLSSFCQKVFISCQKEQIPFYPFDFETITDIYPEEGALGAIVSAFHFAPEASWLVMTCDQPLMDEVTLQELLFQADNTDNLADKKQLIACKNPQEQIEPFPSLWKSSIYQPLSRYFEKGGRALQGFIRESASDFVRPNPAVFFNANTPQEKEIVFQKILSKK